MSEVNDIQNGRIRDNLFRELRKTDIRKFISVVKDYTSRYGDTVDFDIKTTAIQHCRERGPLFVLRAFLETDAELSVAVLLKMAEHINTGTYTPIYVLDSWRMAIELHYSFETLSNVQRATIINAVRRTFSEVATKEFFHLHNETFK